MSSSRLMRSGNDDQLDFDCTFEFKWSVEVEKKWADPAEWRNVPSSSAGCGYRFAATAQSRQDP